MVLMGKFESDSDLKALFEKAKNDAYNALDSKHSALLLDLQEHLKKVENFGVDIKLSPMSLYEKTRLHIDKKHWDELVLVLEVAERQYTIFPIDNNKFYMFNGVNNKHATICDQDQSPTNDLKGTTYDLTDTTSVSNFLKGLTLTAGACAGQQSFYQNHGLSAKKLAPKKQGVTSPSSL